jgi:putative methylase
LPKAIGIRKHDLAIKLQTIGSHPKPKVSLEQYSISADLAAEILFRACYEYDDIEGKSVVDLGAGTGRLVLGASMLGAKCAIGVELDQETLKTAEANSRQLGLSADWIVADIEALRGPVDTVVMNPPFGTRRAHNDVRFLQTAIRISKVTYSIHKTSTREYLERWLRKHGSRPNVILTSDLAIPHQFPFHRKLRGHVEVDIFRTVQLE